MSGRYRHKCEKWILTDCLFRVRYQVQYANPIDFSRESKKLADIIKLYNTQDDSLFVR